MWFLPLLSGLGTIDFFVFSLNELMNYLSYPKLFIFKTLNDQSRELFIYAQLNNNVYKFEFKTNL